MKPPGGAGTIRAAVPARPHRAPVTEDEQREAEEDANAYLHDVGLPADRPYGYRWFQVLPEGGSARDIRAAAYRAIEMSGLPDSHHPREAVPFIRAAIDRLYGGHGPGDDHDEATRTAPS